MGEAIGDDAVVETLSLYAGLVARALDDPADWLGKPEDRVDRVGTVAAFAAATPRFFGMVADRLPLQAAFGAAAAGLGVCGVAREHGVRDPDAWVPLLGKVLFDRDLPRGRSEQALARLRLRRAAAQGVDPDAVDLTAEEPGDELVLPEDRVTRRQPGWVRRGSRFLYRLARGLLGVEGLLDERPRGGLPYRALGKIPVVGVVGGFLDERGAVRKAAEETAELLRAGYLDRGAAGP
jgi:hypothetical protein